MAFVFVLLAALVAVAKGGIFDAADVGLSPTLTRITPIAYTTPVAKAVVAPPVVAKTVGVETNFDPHPQYTFSYSVQDALTGDNKAQTENRNGDVVQGEYSLVEPDGNRRIVEYTADPVNGFNAIVHREATDKTAPVVAKVSAPGESPVVTKVATPVAVASPAITAFSAAPVVRGLAAPVAYATPIAKAFATPVEFATPTIGKALIH